MILKKFFKIKIPLWVICLISIIIVGVWVSGIFVGKTNVFGKKEESVETQVVTAMTKQKQVAVLGLSVTDIYDKTQGGTIFGVDVPFSEKTAYLKGTFEAKLGFDGKKVEIEKSKVEENTYDIIIPEFIVVGISNPDFKVLDNKGELLSFTTEDIDTHRLANKAMNNKTLSKYIKMNEEWLEEQSKDYYEGILKNVDSDAKLRFKFSE